MPDFFLNKTLTTLRISKNENGIVLHDSFNNGAQNSHP